MVRLRIVCHLYAGPLIALLSEAIDLARASSLDDALAMQKPAPDDATIMDPSLEKKAA